jgi:hypothetical protein
VKLSGQGENRFLQPWKGLNLFVYDNQPFAGLLVIIAILPRPDGYRDHPGLLTLKPFGISKNI